MKAFLQRSAPQRLYACVDCDSAALRSVPLTRSARPYVVSRPGGAIAYATCSLLVEENEAQVQTFLARHPRWHLRQQRRFSPLQGGDGFFVALLTQADS